MEIQELAERIFLEKYGNKITASESWLIRFAVDVCKEYNEKEIDLLKGDVLRLENKLRIRGELIYNLTNK